MDAVSYSLASKQAQRIEKFIENPDSTSGIVTVPKTIASGETVTVPAGRVAVLPNVVVDGTLNIDGEVFIPSGSSVDFSNGIKIDGNNIALSISTSYHLLQGNLSVSNEVITNGFSTTLYTGNGSTQSVVTGVDMSTQWGNDTSEQFGGLVWHKARNGAYDNILGDTVQGTGKFISSNTNASQTSSASILSSFSNNGFLSTFFNTTTYVSWNFQTTHRRTGTTNHGKTFTEHYNPFTGFTIIKYEGSGLAGHEIPHSLGRKLGLVTVKNLSNASNWIVRVEQNKSNYVLVLNTLDAEQISSNDYFALNSGNVSLLTGVNASANQYILYGWANSYIDESNKLIGNYEIGTYQGTGATGNKITTKGKPAWVMIKRLDSTGRWNIVDGLRGSFDYPLQPNLSNAEVTGTDFVDVVSDGFILKGAVAEWNDSGGQYLYMVVYDNDSGSGKSKYPKATDTSNVQINNALIPLAHGIDSNGSKNSIVTANETITGLTYTTGKNYLYKTDAGYGVKSIEPSYGKVNPLIGDFYNVITNKWYNNTNAEITESRNYLNHIVHADQNRQVIYVEELPKIEYKDIIKATEYRGKNACTAWANFDGSTTPPTIRDSHNISAVIKVSTGIYDIYFEEPMDNLSYSFGQSVSSIYNGTGVVSLTEDTGVARSKNSIRVHTGYVNSTTNYTLLTLNTNSIQIFGGKN